jgi:tRNA U34 2-thiouridine synthase MnmA/TrmU
MMDMKQKLQETYTPDKDGRRKKVVIALGGGLNSYVTAYLLKIQKYDLIAVTVAVSWDDFKGDPSSSLSCFLKQTDLESIRDFCHQLGIPHLIIKSIDDFKEVVVGNWVGSKMTGIFSDPCWNCHELRMKLLFQKTIELEAHSLATGHMGKIFKHEAHGTAYVHSSNDEASDQSSLLSRLPVEILNKLMLPLSDLHQNEINKLAENFGVEQNLKKLKGIKCFDSDKSTQEYLESNIPEKYRQPGEIIGPEQAEFGEHQGIFHYSFGQSITLPGTKGSEDWKFRKAFFKERRLEIAREDYFIRNKLFLNECIISAETSWMEPFKAVIKIHESDFIECFIYPKNFSSAVIELEAPAYVLEGAIVSVFKKKGKGAKLLFTGKARYIAEPPAQEEGSQIVKVDYSRNF